MLDTVVNLQHVDPSKFFWKITENNFPWFAGVGSPVDGNTIAIVLGRSEMMYWATIERGQGQMGEEHYQLVIV